MLTIPEGAQKSAVNAYANAQRSTQAQHAGSTQSAAKAAAPQNEYAEDRAYEVLPGEGRRGTGLYSVKRGENGEKQINFDRPARFSAQIADKILASAPETEPPAARQAAQGESAQDAPEGAKAAPAKAAEGGRTVADTGRVDAEIERLKEKQSLLKKRLASTDPEKKAVLQKELDMIASELRMKDNDAYRRQNTQFTNL